MRSLLPLLALAAFGCATSEPSDEETLPAPAPRASRSDVKTVKYPSEGGRELAMDIYTPNKEKNLHRAVLLIHGGGWVGGNKNDMAEIAIFLAERGFTAASINYTLAGQKVWPAQFEDCLAAVRYLRSHAKELDVDVAKVAAAGVSAGGHLSMCLGTMEALGNHLSSKVRAVGSISGIHDLNAPLTTAGDQYRIVEQLLGEKGTPDKKARERASPNTFVDRTSAPAYFIQGSDDPLVPQSQSDLAVAKLKQANVETKFERVEKMGHGLSPTRPAEAKALEKFADWLRVQLK